MFIENLLISLILKSAVTKKMNEKTVGEDYAV